MAYDHDCTEQITLSVEGDPGDSYEAMINKALARVSEFLPGVAILRTEEECDPTGDEQWHIGCVSTSISPGGTKLTGTMAILKYRAP